MIADEQSNRLLCGNCIPQWCRILLVSDIVLRLVGVGVLYYLYIRTPSRNWEVWWDAYLHQTGNAAKGHLLLLLFGILLWGASAGLMIAADIQLLRSRLGGVLVGGIGVLLVIALVVWQTTDVAEDHMLILVRFWHATQIGFVAYYLAYILLLFKCGYELRSVPSERPQGV